MSSFISIADAKKMIEKYREEKENLLQPEFQGQDIIVYSETFDRAQFDTILAKPGCVQLRIYYGMGEDMKVHAIVVGADENGQDVLMGETPAEEENDDVIENSLRCPPSCPEP